MLRKIRFHIVLIIVAFIWILYVDSTREKPVNWSNSFYSEHKIPYGTYILNDLLPEFMGKTEVKELRRAPYLVLKDTMLQGTYFFVNDKINFGKEEFNQILDFVQRGNDVFISTFGANIDTLNLNTERINAFYIKENTSLQLSNPNFDSIETSVIKKLKRFGFSSIDSLETEVLGTLNIRDNQNKILEKRINFVRQKFGKGYFYFHLYPHVFTNFYLLKDSTRAYTENVLSYLDRSKPVLMDAYYKSGKSKISSPMYYVLSSDELKWAYYSALLGVLFFVLFQGKRNQRPIPIIEPLKNQTVAFTKTVANLYFEQKDHKAIAKKKAFHFLDFIRTELKLDTYNMNDEFYIRLAEKSGNDLNNVRSLFYSIDQIDKLKDYSKRNLIELNDMIEQFHSNYNKS